ncbi:MAG: FAD-dependent oxidoreductase, partial [Halobacteria archaeon]|nr:FAD-dependent oxidoreductase [Halobacteria archaeon]
MHVAVVGGGIVGLASAYYLSKKGVNVTVCEKSNIGAGSTERSAGGIRTQFSTRVNVALSKESIKVWEGFEEEFGVDIEYRRSGYLFLAREKETDERFKENVEMQNEMGVPSEYLSPEEALEYCPELHQDRFLSGTYSSTDGFADPHLALQGFADRARQEGADIRTGVDVTDILKEDERVTGVMTKNEEIGADFVV